MDEPTEPTVGPLPGATASAPACIIDDRTFDTVMKAGTAVFAIVWVIAVIIAWSQ